MTRFLASLGAAATWVGLGLQLYILLVGPMGPVSGTWRFIAFFTVLMNLFAAIMFTWALVNPVFSVPRARLQSAVAVNMTMVGGAYVLLLEKLWSPQGLQFVADKLLHYVTPGLAVLFWLLCVPKSAMRWSDALRWAVIPLVYLAYALTRGAGDGFYPYFFIDVGALGWTRVLLNSGGLLVVFVVLAAVFIALGKLSSKKLI